MITSVSGKATANWLQPIHCAQVEGQPDRFEPSEPAPLKIWLLHGSYTGGHASAARSVKEAILAQSPEARVEIINHADLSKNPMPFSTAAEKALEGGAIRQTVRNWGFERNFEGDPLQKWCARQSMKVEAFLTDSLLERIQDEQPDVLVATQAPTADMLSYWKENQEFEAPLHAVVTDFGAHQIWSQEGVSRYYVAAESTRGDLERFGVDTGQVSVTGIPIRPAFARPPQDRAEMKKKLGLDPEKPFVLVLGGALGAVNFNKTVGALDDLPCDFQVAVVCGKNEEARKALEADTFSHPVQALGFVDNMVDYLDACDLIVSKPGGLSTSEILARGRAILILDPIPGLETQNARRLTQAGVGRWASDLKDMGKQAQVLLESPDKRAEMEKAALAMGRPNSAADAAKEILAAGWEHRQRFYYSGI